MHPFRIWCLRQKKVVRCKYSSLRAAYKAADAFRRQGYVVSHFYQLSSKGGAA